MKRNGQTEESDSKPPPTKKPKVVKSKDKENHIDGLDDTDSLWRVEEELQYNFSIGLDTSRNICRLLDEGKTIPFIARYRREQTEGMEPDTLRHFKESFESYKTVKEKCIKNISAVVKLGKLTPIVKRSFFAAKSLEELEVAFTPFKTSAKTSLAERARTAGLGEHAENLLTGRISSIDPNSLINSKIPGRETVADIENGLQHVIADAIVYDKDFVIFLRDTQKKAGLVMEVKESKTKENKKDASTKDTKKKTGSNETDSRKFEIYHDFSKPVKFLQSHQVLAINRGESLKFLTVKINIPDWVLQQIEKQVKYQWLCKGSNSKYRTELISASVKDAYKRLITPKIIRNCRAELTKMAENEAIDNFAKNLQKLLLMPPYLGKTILSIDPGFSHGCKIAVISANGDVLDTAIIRPRFNIETGGDERTFAQLQSLVLQYNIDTIAIGNGTACRETENLVDKAIQTGLFKHMKVQYVIVDERGASIYSCTDIAKKEFPKLDTNLISAVSLGRRLQDPLSEYVKIEPHHLGCGMYQHDVKQARLKTALDETVVECVSFVGVNLNSCSDLLLQRVAGLNAARAKSIIDYRREKGDFQSRSDLKKVKGIGEKVFEQCAGFVRVVNSSDKIGKPDKKYNPLDATNIHPESYAAANKVIEKANLDISKIGTTGFKQMLQQYVVKRGVENLASELKIGVPTLNLIVESLEKGLGYDMRESMDGPIFKSGMTRLEDIKVGDTLTGRVNNVTPFGAFVDIGLGKNGLLHNSKMRGAKVELGNRVKVKLINKDLNMDKMAWTASEDEPPFMHDHPVLGPFVRLGYGVIVKPTMWLRKKVEAIRGEPPAYYHRRYERVPTIDECPTRDVVCRFEATQQFLRDKEVESQIIMLLRSRVEDCIFYEKGTGSRAWQPHRFGATVDLKEGSDHKCKPILDTFEKALENFFVKYGECGKMPVAETVYMKQKHRMMWERRHGPIGTGMKEDKPTTEASE